MSATTLHLNYDIYARIYNDRNGQSLCEMGLQPLEKLLLPHLSPGAHILDLCCGTGQLAQQLNLKGYKVTGIDISEGMLDYAQKNAPDVEFIQDDARFFELPAIFDGVISTSDSLNHVMSLEELTRVFQNVYAALQENSLFVFDLNLEERYKTDWWNGSIVGDIKEDYAWAARRSYDPEEKISQTQVTIFHLLNGNWQRADTNLLGRCYSRTEVQAALESVGFTDIKVYDAELDFDIHDWGPGKAYFVGCKQATK
ncbi:class I SAM-dependent DNA methyltransferase [Nostoc sp. NZL]|uniref:class I SAM-dependent DNA methyltransferase n=1 Tax=Nostoc sp. NZL TaxID=2650612 RepID=UPI0018C4F9F5|nr:class I SAM-dependent methyltransferase [Nostoc sp. NZL]MBG1243492.1 class I SAM-dependent methyltransferase [Nostoc sp. NZL]